MTEKEAIKLLSDELKVTESVIGFEKEFENMSKRVLEWRMRRVKGIKMAIKALEEIQQYREIGTVEECREARERRNPKKVVDICGALGEKYECPECGSSLDDADLIAGNCKWCGQKLYE